MSKVAKITSRNLTKNNNSIGKVMLMKDTKRQITNNINNNNNNNQKDQDKNKDHDTFRGIPKKAKTSYIYFCEEERKKLKNESSDMQAKDILIEMGKRWKLLNENDKMKYENLAAQDKSRYENQIKTYKMDPMHGSSLTKRKKGKKDKKDKDAPKRGASSYIFFSNCQRDIVRKEHPEAKMIEISRIIGQKWKEIDEKEKAKYEKMAEQDRLRYNKEMHAYQEKK